MGIYDREYYRRDGPSILGALGGRGQVCKWLIIINVVCFFLQMVPATRTLKIEDEDGNVSLWPQPYHPVTEAFQLDTRAVAHGQVWRLLTYAFLHDTGQILHIVFNMLFLWWFGSELEDRYGSCEFLTFYLTAAVLGGLAFQLAWVMGLQAAWLCVGASGAVMAVMVLYAILYPTRTIYLFGLLPMPVWLLVAIYVFIDFNSFLRGRDTGTAVIVHLGGAAFAGIYYLAGRRLTQFLPDWRAWQRHWSRPRLRVYRGEERHPVSVASSPATPEVDEYLEAKLDAVLEKVARSGRDSLTEAERQILLRASEAFKKRRP